MPRGGPCGLSTFRPPPRSRTAKVGWTGPTSTTTWPTTWWCSAPSMTPTTPSPPASWNVPTRTNRGTGGRPGHLRLWRWHPLHHPAAAGPEGGGRVKLVKEQKPAPAVRSFNVVEAGVGRLRSALESGQVTSEELVELYLERIRKYDSSGIYLNAMVVMNPEAVAEAQASDRRRAAGFTLGPLDGIPYTAKDSYQVRGLTAAAGSHAFEHLVAQRDAFTIERLRAGGAVLIGLTNMPPMANGGMQRGVYGRAESPYSADYLTAAFASGSSNGSGTATAASFAAFGLAEETWSSGRAPASNNALCAYTPSRGVISVRGNWPLVPTMDVVVPHTRTVADMLEVLDVIVADDAESRGDFWRAQPWVIVPRASSVRPPSYVSLGVPDAAAAAGVLAGKRLGVPRMYINADPQAGTADAPGIGGPTGQRIETRASIIALWEAARRDLEAAGAEVIE